MSSPASSSLAACSWGAGWGPQGIHRFVTAQPHAAFFPRASSFSRDPGDPAALCGFKNGAPHTWGYLLSATAGVPGWREAWFSGFSKRPDRIKSGWAKSKTESPACPAPHQPPLAEAPRCPAHSPSSLPAARSFPGLASSALAPGPGAPSERAGTPRESTCPRAHGVCSSYPGPVPAPQSPCRCLCLECAAPLSDP